MKCFAILLVVLVVALLVRTILLKRGVIGPPLPEPEPNE